MTRSWTITRLATLALLLGTGTACFETLPFGGGSDSARNGAEPTEGDEDGDDFTDDEDDYDDWGDTGWDDEDWSDEDWGDDPCVEPLDECLEAAEGDMEAEEACFVAYEECWYELECIDEATGEDLCEDWEDELYPDECELMLDDCLEAGGDPDLCFMDYDQCWYEFECIDPTTGDDLCLDDWSGGDGEACFWLFDDCLILGVSLDTCEQALGECLIAQDDLGEPECEIQLADCLYAGFEPDFCFAGYEQCLTGDGPFDDEGDWEDWDDFEDFEDPCGDAFFECLDEGRPEDECFDELVECDEGLGE